MVLTQQNAEYCRPCESRDPYPVSPVGSQAHVAFEARRLWVPAFAGTTLSSWLTAPTWGQVAPGRAGLRSMRQPRKLLLALAALPLLAATAPPAHAGGPIYAYLRDLPSPIAKLHTCIGPKDRTLRDPNT